MKSETPLDFEYSFRSQFNNFGYLKKFSSLVLLPFLPIYTVSKGFQMRSRKKHPSEPPPSIWKYVIVICSVYFFTAYPLIFSVAYVLLQVFLFPVTLVVTYFLNRRDLVVEKMVSIPRKEKDFQVIGFGKISLTFLGLIILVALVGNYFLLATFTAFVFILFPRIYRYLYFVPKRLLALSYPFLAFLSYIPGVNLRGTWFIEADSEVKTMKNGMDLAKFVISNWKPFFVLNVGISALIVRIILLLRGDPPVQSIISIDALSSFGFLFMFLAVPIIMAVYFVWVWVWEDAELKVAKTSVSTAGLDDSGNEIIETTLLTFASDSISNVFTLAFGIPSVAWLVDKMVSTDQLASGGIVGLVVIILIFFVLTGANTIFMGIMYYRSGIHAELVNKLRNDIRESYTSEEESSVKICYSSVQPIKLEVL
ncbi:MAG: hypothetical protein ACFFFG_17455 [Candidatus Thorarchaeota archaeon]